jgi:hypothetical protein
VLASLRGHKPLAELRREHDNANSCCASRASSSQPLEPNGCRAVERTEIDALP